MEVLNHKMENLSLEEKKLKQELVMKAVRSEYNTLFKFCQNANFNVMVEHPEKLHVGANKDFRNGQVHYTNSKYFVGTYSSDKEKEFMKELYFRLEKLKTDMDDQTLFKRWVLGIAQNCHVMISVSSALRKYCEQL